MGFRVDDCFRKSYPEARSEFLAAARDAGCSFRSLTHPMQESAGVPLVVDVARIGANRNTCWSSHPACTGWS